LKQQRLVGGRVAGSSGRVLEAHHAEELAPHRHGDGDGTDAPVADRDVHVHEADAPRLEGRLGKAAVAHRSAAEGDGERRVRGGQGAADHPHRRERLGIEQPDAVDAPGEERREGAGERCGHVLAGVGLGQLAGEVEQSTGPPRARDRWRLLEEREPRTVGDPAPANVHAGWQEIGDLATGAARGVEADHATEGGVGPGDAPPLDHGRRHRRRLERGRGPGGR
jgi:hypothetical protein